MKEKTIRTTSMSVVMQMLDFYNENKIFDILEPSAGEGILLDHLMSYYHHLRPSIIDCVELNKEKRDILKQNGFNVIGEDFLKLDPSVHTKKYDLIIAAPTYKNNI